MQAFCWLSSVEENRTSLLLSVFLCSILLDAYPIPSPCLLVDICEHINSCRQKHILSLQNEICVYPLIFRVLLVDALFVSPSGTFKTNRVLQLIIMFTIKKLHFGRLYPLVNIQKNIENGPFSSLIYLLIAWWCSIVMLVYQRESHRPSRPSPWFLQISFLLTFFSVRKCQFCSFVGFSSSSSGLQGTEASL